MAALLGDLHSEVCGVSDSGIDSLDAVFIDAMGLLDMAFSKLMRKTVSEERANEIFLRLQDIDSSLSCMISNNASTAEMIATLSAQIIREKNSLGI